jgi:hypothetical protein
MLYLARSYRAPFSNTMVRKLLLCAALNRARQVSCLSPTSKVASDEDLCQPNQGRIFVDVTGPPYFGLFAGFLLGRRLRLGWRDTRDLGAAEHRDVLESGEPEERKAVVRTFLGGITIDKKAGRATLAWFRLPALPNVGLKLVELRGVEPLTPRLPALCSPN